MQAADPNPHPVSAEALELTPRPRPVFVRPPRRSPVRRGFRRSGTLSAPGAHRRSLRALAGEVGQGTVEYVGLLLLMATVLAAVVAAAGSLGGTDKIGKQVVTQIGDSIQKAGGSSK